MDADDILDMDEEFIEEEEEEEEDGEEDDADETDADDTDDDTDDTDDPDSEAAYVAKIEELAAQIADRDIQIATLTGQLAGAQQANRDLLALIGAPADPIDEADESEFDTVPETAVDALYND